MLPNQDKLTNSIRALPYDKVMEVETTDGWSFYHKSRVTTPTSPVVVRRNSPRGPQYREAAGYTFLLNVVAFPGLARMDDGTLVLTLNGQAQDGDREEFLLFSQDEGESWSRPRRIPGQRAKPFNLDGHPYTDKLTLGMLAHVSAVFWSLD